RCVAALALLLIVSPASSEWKPEYAQASPERQQWFQLKRINPEAQKRLNVPFKSCCDNGDVFKTRFRVGTVGKLNGNISRATTGRSYQRTPLSTTRHIPIQHPERTNPEASLEH